MCTIHYFALVVDFASSVTRTNQPKCDMSEFSYLVDSRSSHLNEIHLFSHRTQSPGPHSSNDVWRSAPDLPRVIHDAGTDAACLMQAQRSRPDVAEDVSVL
jgi:hypothetical protein